MEKKELIKLYLQNVDKMFGYANMNAYIDERLKKYTKYCQSKKPEEQIIIWLKLLHKNFGKKIVYLGSYLALQEKDMSYLNNAFNSAVTWGQLTITNSGCDHSIHAWNILPHIFCANRFRDIEKMIDVGKYSFRDKISGVMCMGVLGHLKRDEQEKLLYKLDKNLNINVPILIELLEPKFLVAPVGSRISVATQGRLRYETYITDIKQVGMDQWTWRLTYKVFCGKNIVSTVDSLMSWNYQSVEKILNQLTKMHFRTAKLSETLLLAIKAR